VTTVTSAYTTWRKKGWNRLTTKQRMRCRYVASRRAGGQRLYSGRQVFRYQTPKERYQTLVVAENNERRHRSTKAPRASRGTVTVSPKSATSGTLRLFGITAEQRRNRARRRRHRGRHHRHHHRNVAGEFADVLGIGWPRIRNPFAKKKSISPQERARLDAEMRQRAMDDKAKSAGLPPGVIPALPSASGDGIIPLPKSGLTEWQTVAHKGISPIPGPDSVKYDAMKSAYGMSPFHELREQSRGFLGTGGRDLQVRLKSPKMPG
jgi:hypothetical protein